MKKKKKYVIIILLVLFFLLAILLINQLLGENKPLKNLLPIEDGQEANINSLKGKGSTEIIETTNFYGYNKIYLSDEKKGVDLVNLRENTVFLKYEIKLDDKFIYKSDLIKPNEMITADFYNLLKDGENLTEFYIYTYDLETQNNLSNVKMNVAIYK